MKKLFKIVGISLGTVIGLVMLTLSTVLWVVFTPARLTPIVSQVADEMLTCEYHLGKVELTFFSTFPKFGLHVDTLCLLHPLAGAQQDTLLYASEMLGVVDLQELWQNKHLKVHQLSLTDLQGYIYQQDSLNNYSVFVLPSSTPDDTVATDLPFEKITVDELVVNSRQLVYDNRSDSIEASIGHTTLHARMVDFEDMYLSFHAQDVCANVGGEVYAEHLSVSGDLPLLMDKEILSVELNEASLQVNDYRLTLDGIVNLSDSLSMQMHLNLADWQIKPLLALVPASLSSELQDLDVDGRLSVDADVAGVISQNQLPIVDATILLQEGKGTHSLSPFAFHHVSTEMDVHLDMNNKRASSVDIQQLTAKTRYSSLQVRGKVVEPLTDMRLKLHVGMNMYMPEFASVFPKNVTLEGRVKGSVDVQGRLEDLTQMHIDKTQLSGQLHLYELAGKMDTLQLASPEMHVAFELPNRQPYAGKMDWAYAKVDFRALEVSQSDKLAVSMGASEVAMSVSDVLDTDALLHADVNLVSTGNLDMRMDNMQAHVETPQLHVQAIYDRQDTTAIPVANMALSYGALTAAYDQIWVDMLASDLSVNIASSENDATIPVVMAGVNTEGLHAKMDSTLEVTTEMLAVAGITHYNKHADNILLKWNPQLQVNMLNGHIQTSMLDKTISIPHIDFAYTNREFHIEDSRLLLGNSDFSLSGDVRNIADWMNGEGNLEGDMVFESSYTDVNELMALFSAETGSEEAGASPVRTTSASLEMTEPFLVPTNLDLTLRTKIDEARVFGENLRSLKGKLYVQDGVLILEEMGFICKAAQLQLTAMYRTPRRNHIYVGMDYHMMNINIEELVRMIPQLDTIVPMLNSFKGKAEFHLAAETYTNANYKIKPSTLRGACSLSGKDLVVMDSETFSKLSKKLMFNKKTENKVDSISAEMTVYKKEIDLYPMCISMDNYIVALGGRHNLDMTFDYDVNVLSPIYLGVNVSGDIDNLDIKLTKCKYAKDFRPVFQGKVNQQSATLRSIIRESMHKNVRIGKEQ